MQCPKPRPLLQCHSPQVFLPQRLLEGSIPAACAFSMAFHFFIATSLMFFTIFFWTTLEIIIAGLWNKSVCVMKFLSLKHLLFSQGICLSGIHVSLVLVVSTSHDYIFMRKLRAEWKTHSWRFSATRNCLKLQSTLQSWWFSSLLKCTFDCTCSQNHRSHFMFIFHGLLTK